MNPWDLTYITWNFANNDVVIEVSSCIELLVVLKIIKQVKSKIDAASLVNVNCFQVEINVCSKLNVVLESNWVVQLQNSNVVSLAN